jgi:hypothetical protein
MYIEGCLKQVRDGGTKSTYENDKVKIVAYKVGGLTRIDVKEK